MIFNIIVITIKEKKKNPNTKIESRLKLVYYE